MGYYDIETVKYTNVYLIRPIPAKLPIATVPAAPASLTVTKSHCPIVEVAISPNVPLAIVIPEYTIVAGVPLANPGGKLQGILRAASGGVTDEFQRNIPREFILLRE